jgi:predicted DNA-binding transcriptional regulator AlpA
MHLKETNHPQQSLYVSLAYLVSLLNISASTIRRLELAGKFPKRRQLSMRRVGWELAAVKYWADNREMV